MIIIHLVLFFVIGRSSGEIEIHSGAAEPHEENSHAFPEPMDHSRLFYGGSQVAEIEEAPYVVALVDEISNLPFCTGTIIDELWVVSAAHCIHGLTIEAFEIVAGCDSMDEIMLDSNSSTRQVRDPIAIKVHPYYKAHVLRYGYDIVLIKVASFVFGPGVNRIGLSAMEWQGNKTENFFTITCTAFGWGKERYDTESEFLRKADFTVQHGDGGCGKCIDDDLSRRMICTPVLSRHSVCPGDSGGPLVCHGLLAGVAHTLAKCSKKTYTSLRCGQKAVFSTWTYVCPMLNWIHKVVPDTPDPPLSCRSHHLVLPGLAPKILLASSLLHKALTNQL